MNLTAERLATSAQQFMAENPSKVGWKRHQASSYGGGHRSGVWIGDGLIYWRRPRDMFDDTTYRMLDPGDDPVLWVAESVTSDVVLLDLFLLGQHPPGDHPPKAGATARLDTANGFWIWQLVGEWDCVCGGWMARWPD